MLQAAKPTVQRTARRLAVISPVGHDRRSSGLPRAGDGDGGIRYGYGRPRRRRVRILLRSPAGALWAVGAGYLNSDVQIDFDAKL